jgi:hypothetical protein
MPSSDLFHDCGNIAADAAIIKNRCGQMLAQRNFRTTGEEALYLSAGMEPRTHIFKIPECGGGSMRLIRAENRRHQRDILQKRQSRRSEFRLDIDSIPGPAVKEPASSSHPKSIYL